MAIAKMRKVKLISFQEHKNAILQAIQGLASVELIDISAEYEKAPAMSPQRREQLDNWIKDAEVRHDEIENALRFLGSYLEQPSLLKQMRIPRRSMTIEEMERELGQFEPEEILADLQQAERELKQIADQLKQLGENEEFLTKWKNLSVHPRDLLEHEHVGVALGAVPQTASDDFIRSLKENPLLHIEELYQNRDEYGLMVVYDRLEAQQVRQLLDNAHFLSLQYPFDAEPLKELRSVASERDELKKREKEIKARLAGMSQTQTKLQLMSEAAYAKVQRLRGQMLLVDERHLFVLEGWLEESKLTQMQDVLNTRVPHEQYAVIFEEATEEEVEKVPIVLENHPVVAPFENITSMYSMPKYNEIDPTPFLMPFYLIFFGMMLADLGYGLLMWAATFLALRAFSLTKGMRKNMQFFHLLSYSTILWGLVYGSFFGIELPIVLLSTTEDVNTILIISVVFGVIQMLVGLSIKTYLYLRDNDRYAAVSDGVGWITIFVGIILMVLGNLVFPSPILANAGAAVAVVGALSILVASSLGSENKAMGAGAGLYNLYGITGYVGDIVSYTRLMALGVSGGSIGLAFNMIIGFLPTGARFTVGILLFIVLHMVNLGLSALSAYVHGARLIFVEFFGKFYEGGGKPLNPLKTSEEYIDLKNNKEN